MDNNYQPQQDTLSAGQASLGQLFSSVARAFANETAIVDGDKSLSFKQLDDRSNRLANALLCEGLEVGDRVAILARNCTEYLELELAAAKIGVIVAALNWRLADRELDHCIKLVGPKLLVLQAEYELAVDRLKPDVQSIWEIGDDLERRMANQSVQLPPISFDNEAGLVILYTSGTTGMPKGALISHRAMIARAALFFTDLQLKHQAGFVAWAPLFHMASTDQGLATLLHGGTVYIVDGYQPERLADLVETVSIGWFVLMPGMVGEFAAYCEDRKVKPLDITVCGAMADLVPKTEIKAVTKVLNTPYLNSFGATETGLAPATASRIAIDVLPENLHKRQSSMADIRLVDADENDVPVGTPGEVALRGPTLFSGYWNASKTNEHDFRNGWFHMGDVMRRGEDGLLDYVDRVKYMIKSGGENIYPAEIEQVVAQCPGVHEAIVVRQADKKWGEVPVLFVVKASTELSRESVLQHCKKHLSSYKLPKNVLFIEDGDLPRSTTGKIQRHILEERLTAG